jgi:AmiR/NasT family two-component response regulator
MVVGGALVSQAVPLEHRASLARSALVAAANEGQAVLHEFDGLKGHPLHAAVVTEMERLTGYADAQERKVGQLQSALDSRVAIEQAIGMLAERFNIPFKDAFELLRAGARNTRQQVRAIAEELRESRQTPPEIRDLLPKDVQRE